jgi:hypothetical protein
MDVCINTGDDTNQEPLDLCTLRLVEVNETLLESWHGPAWLGHCALEAAREPWHEMQAAGSAFRLTPSGGGKSGAR